MSILIHQYETEISYTQTL